MAEPMKISPKYTISDWNRLDLSSEKDWQKAIDIFEDRIRGRFLDIIDKIGRRKFSGFAVLALDCLLIETLQQFFEGIEKTPWNKGKEYFVKFLTETSFKEFFDKKKAKKFHDHFRNGILHQGETKGNSKVRNDKKRHLVGFTPDREGLVVNRGLFHRQLKKVFEEYVRSLREGADTTKRNNFKKKMDFICRKAKEV